MNIVEIWMSIIGVSMAFAGLPQIFRIWKRKSSDDVSMLLFFIIFHGQVWWIFYSYSIGSISLFLTNATSIIFNGTILILTYKYRSHRKGVNKNDD